MTYKIRDAQNSGEKLQSLLLSISLSFPKGIKECPFDFSSIFVG